MRQADSGLPRILGQIWALLVTIGEPLTAAEIAGLLSVSRASVSTNTALLLNMGLIEKQPVSGKRTVQFAVRKHPYRHFLRVLTDRMQTMSRVVGEMAEATDRPGSQATLEDLAAFYRSMEAAFRSVRYPPSGADGRDGQDG
ncbi:hypothetical protein B5C34_15645 [Pacificimonas flava]|uniref:HTH marR-type domain-containing protein n=2 Tax=Pacificimonas TaxID=1960290 RepID=A0A219B0S0_9SPHN|nr:MULTISPECIES: MarR family transcriptional regulator [Pacificimonas]MBZ6379601.1 hypothetical protein [Pacificimonas aurantium]OWV31927.1 hypothetical protein B5C34_15645 [Pacificimonas flava]